MKNIIMRAMLVGALSIGLAGAVFTNVHAQERDNQDNEYASGQEQDHENGQQESRGLSVNVKEDGSFKASGAVITTINATTSSGVTTGTLGLKMFGINFSVNINNAQLYGNEGARATAADYMANDVITLEGTINNANGAITASTIKNQTLQSRTTGGIKSQILELMKMVEWLRAQLKTLTQ